MSISQQPPLAQVGKLISLIPVGLKEAALDSPTFRATVVHYSDQIDLIEKWLDSYVKSVTKLTSEVSTLEGIVNTFIFQASLPPSVSEAVLDPDYTLLAMKRYGEGTKEFWSTTIASLRRLEPLVADPIKSFLNVDIKTFKDIRRTLDHLQKTYDQIQSRYSSQTKTKEPSALREDAFQLHEARKSYLKVSMDFCAVAPQLRNSLDKLLVRIFFDQWKEMKSSRESTTSTFGKWSQEMDRIRGWTRELEGSEKTFRRELHAARREIEETAEAAARPSRELEDYSVSTVPYLGSGGMSTLSLKSPGKPGMGSGPAKSEKQGWLYLRTYSGKPTRTVWVRRWGFVKNGIFGWLIQGARSSGVEESERIGVLLCNVRPASQEERRFCFEVKTKNNAMMLQAETEAELMDWISTFEAAKQKALDNPASTDIVGGGKGGASSDPAFSISPPPAPEFAATLSDSLSPQSVEEQPGQSFDRSSTLPVPGTGDAAFIRSSVDVSNSRRSAVDKDGEGSRDHASRIIQKLDLHRKSTAGPATSSGTVTPSPVTPIGGGGIASLISASHNLHNMLPAGSGMVSTAAPDPTKSILGIGGRDMAPSSLAPSTLANPPAPTSLSQAAVSVSGERGIGVGRADTTGGMPSGIMANLWGSSNWGYLNRLERGELRQPAEPRPSESPMPSPELLPALSPPKGTGLGLSFEENQRPDSIAVPDDPSAKRSQTPSPNRHRNTISLDGDAAKIQRAVVAYSQEFPNYYPIQLKTQDAQFRLLFPNVRRSEKVILVFRATWNPNDQQEFPGRAYITTQDIYFYSNHLGLVLTSGLGLSSISEVTAAPGKDCDFLFLHMEPGKDEEVSTRVTIKIFLEPLKLLQTRLNYLIRNSGLEEQDDLETVIKTLIKLETDEPHSSPSLESWEDVSLNTPVDEGARLGRAGHSRKISKDLKAPIHVDRALNGDPRSKDVAKFKLPSRPIEYVPQGSFHVAVEKQFSISPKALFHVLFGDKSAVWQLLYYERDAQGIKKGPWISLDKGHLSRDFEYQVDAADLLGRVQVAEVSDYQLIDVMNDHLCYVVTDKRTPWHLPYRQNFMLVTKVVITHVAKSKSKIAIFTKVDWLRSPPILKKVIEQKAMEDLNQDALDLTDLVSDQVGKLGAHSRTKKAIEIFGAVGQETQVSHFGGGGSPLEVRRLLRRRTFSHLLYEAVGSFVESAVSSVMIWAMGIIRWVWKTSSAHSIILLTLLLSALVNGFFWTRDGYEWWHERNAGKFLSRVGVTPNMVMSKAIYMNDMDDAVANMTGLITGDLSSCYTTFRAHKHLHDLDAPTVKSSLSSSPSTYRLQRTRQQLGSRRHDLLVALRVINRIETELLTAEWEKWILDENRRCWQVGMLLDEQARRNETGAQQTGNGRKEKVQKALKKASGEASTKDGADKLFGDEMYQWYEDYCGSCRKEQERLDESYASWDGRGGGISPGDVYG